MPVGGRPRNRSEVAFYPGMRVVVNETCYWKDRRGEEGTVIEADASVESVEVKLDSEPANFENGATCRFVWGSLSPCYSTRRVLLLGCVL